MKNNFLSKVDFKIAVKRLPNVQFRSQKVTIPGISGSAVRVPSPNGDFWKAYDKIDYSNFDLNFIVDEDLESYLEILRWMEDIGSYDNFQPYKKISESLDGVFSDITVLISNSSRNINLKITLQNCFPISISPIALDITAQDVEYLEAIATFQYDKFSIEKL